MQRFHSAFIDNEGNVLSSAQCWVYDHGTSDLSSIYEDQAQTPKSNPFTLGNNAAIDFYADDGQYDIQLTKSGYDTQYWYDVQFLDRADVYSAITGASNGIKYYWDDIAARNAEAGMVTDETGLMKDSAQNRTDEEVGAVYKYSGAVWEEQYKMLINGAENAGGIYVEGITFEDGLIDAVYYPDFVSKNLIIDVQSNTTVDVDADSIILINSSNNGYFVSGVDLTFTMPTDLIAGAELASHQYQMWTDENSLHKLVPDLTGTADGNTANKLIDSAADWVTYDVHVGDELYNLTDLTKGYVGAVDDLNTIACVDGDGAALDLFPAGTEDYRIHMLSPTGMGAFKANAGKVWNAATGHFTDSRKNGQARITTAFWHTPNGFGTTNTKIQKYTTETDASDDVVVTVKNKTGAAADDGFSVAANMDCKVNITINSSGNAATFFGISKNSNQLTTNIETITAAHRVNFTESKAANEHIGYGGEYLLKKGDILRPHVSAAGDGANQQRNSITVVATEII